MLLTNQKNFSIKGNWWWRNFLREGCPP